MALDWEKFIKESEATAPDETAVAAVAAFFIMHMPTFNVFNTGKWHILHLHVKSCYHASILNFLYYIILS